MSPPPPFQDGFREQETECPLPPTDAHRSSLAYSALLLQYHSPQRESTPWSMKNIYYTIASLNTCVFTATTSPSQGETSYPSPPYPQPRHNLVLFYDKRGRGPSCRFAEWSRSRPSEGERFPDTPAAPAPAPAAPAAPAPATDEDARDDDDEDEDDPCASRIPTPTTENGTVF